MAVEGFSGKLIASSRPLSGGKIEKEMSDVEHRTLLLLSIATMRQKFRKQHCFPSVSNLHKFNRKIAHIYVTFNKRDERVERACEILNIHPESLR